MCAFQEKNPKGTCQYLVSVDNDHARKDCSCCLFRLAHWWTGYSACQHNDVSLSTNCCSFASSNAQSMISSVVSSSTERKRIHAPVNLHFSKVASLGSPPMILTLGPEFGHHPGRGAGYCRVRAFGVQCGGCHRGVGTAGNIILAVHFFVLH